MDVLRKELNQIYLRQNLDCEELDENVLKQCTENIATYVAINNSCCVITDASANKCQIIAGSFARFLGLTDNATFHAEFGSSDEDLIYNRIHPEDIVEKRMLEYEFFKFIDNLDNHLKPKYKATCRIRIKDCNGEYLYVDNSTQILRQSPCGKIWLILCCYDIAQDQTIASGIFPRIINNENGEIITLSLAEKRAFILSSREKEILNLIKEGYASKQIAGMLGISIHTVNRHRQNILEKLCVGNSLEAVLAASAMKLL